MIMYLQSLVSFYQFVLKILSKNQILISIKGRNSFANFQKTMIYDTNIDLVNDNVYTVILLREGHVSSHSNISYFFSVSRCVILTIFVLEYSEKYQDYISGLNY